MKRFGNRDATIRDVARAAGVSVTTASYALNGQGRVALDTQARVRDAALSLGYRPSLAAQALKGARGSLVVILTDGFAGPWYGELLEGLQPTLKQAGYTVAAITAQDDSVELCYNLVQAGIARGLVVLNPRSDWETRLRPLCERVPTVVFGEVSGPVQSFVLDNEAAMDALMTHLWDQGHRHYLWVGGPEDDPDARQRCRAFEAFLDTRPSSRQGVQGGFQSSIAYSAVTEALGIPGPTALVAANDESAIGALRAARDRGLRVPEDLVVTGFDGIDAAAWTEPGLTTLAFDRRLLGRTMARGLIDVLPQSLVVSTVHPVAVNLVVRQSTVLKNKE